ncbi:sclerostin domain-containing protein 1a [Menidia menidia]
MHLSAHESCHSLLLLCILLRSCQALKNDATEMLTFPRGGAPPPPGPDAHSNASPNRARNGGRGAVSGAGGAPDRGERSQIVCRELRSTKYISDGQCTSINPIKELVCAGECLPAQMLDNWIGGGAHGRKFWARRSGQDWRCVNDKTRTQRIRLQCQDGSARTYKITAVTSCKCKRYSRQHNESGHKPAEPVLLLHKHQAKAKRRPGKAQLGQNQHEPAA